MTILSLPFALRKPELLAPAGDLEKLTYALAFGADAVYVGGLHWGMRANASNFSLEELRAGADLVHCQGKKIYVTVNIFAHEEDFSGLASYLLDLAEIAIDGLIVSDPGILRLAQQIVPHIPLHLSTQMNCLNSHSANFWLDQGVQRIILARELSRNELVCIGGNVTDRGELEIFIHGAMCMAYSGRCYLSHYLSGRDANHGSCAQSCRWQYTVIEEKRPDEYIHVEEDERGTYIFNSCDLCLLQHVPDLARLNLTSWKIEGRMKSLHYLARTVKVYREAIDTYWEHGEDAFHERLAGWKKELAKASHRPYTTGFFQNDNEEGFVRNKAFTESKDSANKGDHSFVGRGLLQKECSELQPEGAWVQQRNYFAVGDEIEILTPKYVQQIKVERMWDQAGNPVDAARHGQMKVRLDLPALPEYAVLSCRRA